MIGRIDPNYPVMSLGDAIEIAVRLRSDDGVVAMSGGVDSALVARLAGRECVVVGIDGSHDLLHAKQVADMLDLSLERVLIDPGSIEDRLRQVLHVIPKIDPVNASIARLSTMWQNGPRSAVQAHPGRPGCGRALRWIRPIFADRNPFPGSGEGFPGALSSAGKRSGRGCAPWHIFLSALHGCKSSRGGVVHSRRGKGMPGSS